MFAHPRFITVAVVGKSRESIEQTMHVLARRRYPLRALRVIGPERMAGQRVIFDGKEYEVENAAGADWSDIDLAFLADDEAAGEFRPDLIKSGAGVIAAAALRN